jgi:serine protease Do
MLKLFLKNREAFAFDPRNPNAGFRYLPPPSSISNTP